MSGPPPRDTRGIVDPDGMLQVVSLHRYPAGAALEGIVEWFWAVAWDLPAGSERVQHVLAHPSANICVGTSDEHGETTAGPLGRVYGVTTTLASRRLTGAGWNVAAKTTTGGLGALFAGPASALTDGWGSLDVVGLANDAIVAQVAKEPDEQSRVEVIREAVASVVARARPDRVAQARRVAEIARLAERDRSIREVTQLARAAGVGVRTVQRLFAEYAGVSPLSVVRRWRIIEAAERAGGGEPVDWAQLAAQLGYSDQPHLVRDFTRHFGQPPAAFRRGPSPGPASSGSPPR